MNEKYTIKIDFKPLRLRQLSESWKAKAESIEAIQFPEIDYKQVLKKIKAASMEAIQRKDVYFRSREKRMLSERLLALDQDNLLDKACVLFKTASDKCIPLNAITFFMKKYSNRNFNEYLHEIIPKVKLPDKNWRAWVKEVDTVFSQDPTATICSKVVNNKIFFEEIDPTFGLIPNTDLHKEVLQKLFLMDVINYLKMYKPSRLVELMQTKKYEGVKRQIIDGGIHAYYDDAVKDRNHLFYQYIKRNIGHPDEFKFKSQWMGISDAAKAQYRQWLIALEIEDFFSNVSGDHERLAYWKRKIKYISAAYKIFGKYDNDPRCLVMRIKKYNFFEFPQKGNALYVYEAEKVELHNRISNVKELKDPDMVVSIHNATFGMIKGRIRHTGRWTSKVDALILAAGK